MKPILWGRISSTNVQKIIWAAKELNIDYDHQIVGGHYGGTHTEAFGMLNPNRTIPVWQDEEIILWESQAILRYLARRSGKLYGTTQIETALIDQWLDWNSTVFWPPIRLLYLEFYNPKRSTEGIKTAQDAIMKINSMLELMNKQLQQYSFIAGNQFSLADIVLAIALNRLQNMGFGTVLPHNLESWFYKLNQRPAFSEAVTN